MTNKGKTRDKKIRDLISVVKIISILLTGVILWRTTTLRNDGMGLEYFKGGEYKEYFSIICIIVAVMVLYLFWIASLKYKFKYIKTYKCIDGLIFLSLFTFAIIISGGHLSTYKYAFLFIIISYSIDWGMKEGLIIAAVSSAIVVGIDMIFVRGVEVNSYVEDDIVLSGVFFLTAWSLGFYVDMERHHINKLEELVYKDGLTGLNNHAYFRKELKEKVLYSKQNNESLALIFMDVDYFKIYNDTNGHPKGDYVLKKVANIIEECISKKDIAARYGGEEFVVILPDADEKKGAALAENIRKVIEETAFDNEESQPGGRITASFGVSVYPDKAESDGELIKTADEALYKAKSYNRNNVVLY